MPEPPATGDTGASGPIDTGKYGPCLCACDSLDSRIGLNLLLPGLAVLAQRRRSRREILASLTDGDVLAPDVAARLRQRGDP